MPALKLATIAAFAIFRFAYNQVGDNLVAASICGSSFFINNKTALTANHIFKKQKHEFQNYKYWLISRDGKIISISEEFLTHYPEIDLTVINFPDSQVKEAFELSEDPPLRGEAVYSQGYIHGLPKFRHAWSQTSLNIHEMDLSGLTMDKEGTIKTIEKISLSYGGIPLGTPKMIELSFGGVEGMSGGPLIRKSDSKVVGMVSFGQPPYAPVRTVVYAISVDEIKRKLF